MSKKRKPANFDPVVARLEDARATSDATTSAQVATVQEQIAAISRGDFEAALRNASPDIELEIYMPPEFPFIARARGVEALRHAMAHNFSAVEDQQPVISNVVASGDVLVMFGTERGLLRATGAPYHVQFVHRFTFSPAGTLQNIRIIAARAN